MKHSASLDNTGKPAGVNSFFQALVNNLYRAVYVVAFAVIVIIMCLLAADAILRYFFNSPVLGSAELIEFMMAILVFLGLAYSYKHNGHIGVEVLVERFSPRVREVISTINCFATLAIFVLIGWRLLVHSQLLKTGQYYSSTFHIPTYPFLYVAALGTAVLCIVLISEFVGHIKQLLQDHNQWSTRAGVFLLMLLVWLVFTLPLWAMGWIGGANPLVAGILFIVFLIAVIFFGIPIGPVMSLIGFLGLVYLSGIDPSLSTLAIIPYGASASYDNSVIPLFVLMGVFCFHAGLSRDLYNTAYKWLGRLPGGLAMATIAACAGFAAVSGSGAATAATMGTVAIPEMKRFKYSPALTTGCIAAGGTIGILIPPSIPMVIYGILTQQSIGKLFLAGFLPGILQALFYIATIYILCKIDKRLGPVGPSTSFKEKVVSLKDSWGVVVLFLLVIGGLYFGIFTPTEAAGIGAFGAFVFALSKRRLNWKNFTSSLTETGVTTGMIFILIIGGLVFGQFLILSRLPFNLAEIISAWDVNRYIILTGIILIYIFLGCIMSSMAMIIITVPIFYPVISTLGFDAIWFGIIVVRMVEIGAITPPVGLNVFIIKGIAKDVPMFTIFQGITPFLLADVVHVILLVAVPGVVLLVPNLMR